MTAVAVIDPAPGPRRKVKPFRPGSVLAQVFMIVMAALWIVPIVFAFYVSLRPYADTSKYGYVSLPHHLTLKNYSDAWNQSDMLQFFVNSLKITIPAVIVTLFLASMVAFVVSRISFKLNIPLLIMFTAGNLLPPQVLITPLYRLFLYVHVPQLRQRQRAALQLDLRPDRRQRVLPGRVLRLRAVQLHEEHPRRDVRGSGRRRERRCGPATGGSPCRCAGPRWRLSPPC